MKLDLKNITLMGADGYNLDRLELAADISNSYCNFYDTILLSNLENKTKYKSIDIGPINSVMEYSMFMVKEFGKYFETDYVLVFQHDGFVLNPKAWSNEFLEWDYIGAEWRSEPPMVGNGNGGFSLRSKKLFDILVNDDNISNGNGMSEDWVICITYREYLESLGIKFAPIEICNRFSYECGVWNGQFGYHGCGGNINLSKWKDKNKWFKL